MKTDPIPDKPMTLQRAAELALMAQDACNLSGVVHSFSRILTEVIWSEARALQKGTSFVNKHPITKLFAHKIFQLAVFDRTLDQSYDTAYKQCRVLAEGARFLGDEEEGD